jgi:DNA polymerase theta
MAWHGMQVILFCPSRRQCEVCATILSKALLLISPPNVLEDRALLVRKLTESPGSLDPTLRQTIQEGVAFHHAGLTDEEKQGIEDGFRSKTLSVLVATTTLGAGINLPVARVIFRSVKAGGRPMDIASYRQMAGRAGRAGHMTYGESILIAKNEGEAKEARRLMNESLPKLESCLWPDADGGRGMVRAILEAVTAGALKKVEHLDAFLSGTLMAQEVSSSGRIQHKWSSSRRSSTL